MQICRYSTYIHVEISKHLYTFMSMPLPAHIHPYTPHICHRVCQKIEKMTHTQIQRHLQIIIQHGVFPPTSSTS